MTWGGFGLFLAVDRWFCIGDCLVFISLSLNFNRLVLFDNLVRFILIVRVVAVVRFAVRGTL